MATAVFTAATLFQPTLIQNCSLWLDSQDTTVFYTDSSLTTPATPGLSIGCWVDKSSSKNNAIQNNTSPINQQPIYGQNAVVFNKTNTNVLLLPDNTIPSGNSPYSIYIVLTPNSPDQDIVLSCGTPGEENTVSYSTYTLMGISSSTFTNTSSANLLSGGIAIQGGTTLIEIIYTIDSNRSIYQNGNLVISGVTSGLTTGSSYNYLGAGVLQGLYSSCMIHEVVVFRDASTEDLRQKMEAYLTWKWTLQKALPLTHPYFNNTIYAYPHFPKGPVPRGMIRLTTPLEPTIPKLLVTVNFQPTVYSGCICWLDGADSRTVTQSNGLVTQWHDKSGLGVVATAEGSLIYQNRGITFSNSAFFNLPDGCLPAGDSEYTYFIIFTYTDSSSYGALLSGGTYIEDNAFILRANGAGNIRESWWLHDIQANTPYIANKINMVETWYRSGATRNILLNCGGYNYDTTYPGRSQTTTTNYLGKSYDDEFLTGNLYEIIIYNRSLTTKERTQVEGYLAWKWKINNYLPANSAFKHFPPPPQ